MAMVRFNFEDLEVWKKAIDFAGKIIKITEGLKTDRMHYRLVEQLESSAASVAMNIAEGKGRYSKKEFVQFLYIARGSLFEATTLLLIFYKNNWIDEKQINEMKPLADEIGKMLSGLISSIKTSIN